MKIIVFGSYNIDLVYTLPYLPERGETLYCEKYEKHVGGKGLNQALAFKMAGAEVIAAGKVGADGAYLTDKLDESGVDTSFIDRSGAVTGHTIISVDHDGQNQMILFGGANREITPGYCDALLAAHPDADLVLTQYETSCVEYMIEAAKRAGIKTAVNPSPYVDEVKGLPYDKIDYIILNEFEGASITGKTDPGEAVRALHAPGGGKVILTLGAAGSVFYDGETEVRADAFKVDAVDTTGAGDTFTGYSLCALLAGESPADALRRASAASAIEVTRPGAAETIPAADEVESFLKSRKS